MPADAKKRVREQLKQSNGSQTAWDVLEADDILGPPLNTDGVAYPKNRRSKRIDPYDLPRLPTRVLLRYLAYARGDGECIPTSNPYGKIITTQEIKAELAKRPHVPSKREGSVLRQQKKHSRSMGRRPPAALIQEKP